MATKLKKFKIPFILSAFLCLTGCSTNEFKEKEGYEFDYDKYIPLIQESYDEIEQYYEISLNFSFHRDEKIALTLNPMNDCQWKLRNQYAEYQPEITESMRIEDLNNYCPHFKEEDGYRFYSKHQMSRYIFTYIHKINNNYEFRFAHTEDNFITTSGLFGIYSDIVNAIEYNGIYAYSIHYIFEAQKIRDYNQLSRYAVIYLLASTRNLGYDIYYSDKPYMLGNKIIDSYIFRQLYFIPQNPDFSNKFIKYFNEDKNIHYLDINKIREKLNIII